MMEKDNIFWICIWSIVAVVIITLATLIYMGSAEYNKQTQQNYNKCIESGGSWVPGYREAVCLRK